MRRSAVSAMRWSPRLESAQHDAHSLAKGRRGVDVDEYEAQLEHLVRMARDPGFVGQAKHRAQQLERIWPGITEAARAEINRLESK